MEKKLIAHLAIGVIAGIVIGLIVGFYLWHNPAAASTCPVPVSSGALPP